MLCAESLEENNRFNIPDRRTMTKKTNAFKQFSKLQNGFYKIKHNILEFENILFKK